MSKTTVLTKAGGWFKSTALGLSLVLGLLTVSGSAQAATAVADTVKVTADAETPFNVLSNDTGTNIGVTSASPPAHGSVILSNGLVRYKPTIGYTGADTFNYSIRDGYKYGACHRGIMMHDAVANNDVMDSGYGSACISDGSGGYWLLTDRGPNSDGSPSGKVFPVPSFNPCIGHFVRGTDGYFKLVSKVSLKRPNGTTLLTGLPNPNNAWQGVEVARDTLGNLITYKADAADPTGGQDPFGLDSEGLALDAAGNFWISDEYGPYIARYSPTGVEQERLSPVAVNAQGHKLPQVLARRRSNKGMEGLCITPSGKLVGIMQQALQNNFAGTAPSGPKNDGNPVLRIVVYDPVTGKTKQFIYLSQDPGVNGGAVSEIACISETKFLVDERNGKFVGASGAYKKIYEIDITGATDVSDPTDSATGLLFDTDAANPVNKTIEELCEAQSTSSATTTAKATDILVNLKRNNLPALVFPVSKTEVANLVTLLGNSYDHDKVEGLCVLATTGSGANMHASKIAISNDDDFGLAPGSPADNKFYPKLNNQGLLDYNEIIEIDLTATGTSTAAVSVTVAAVTPYLVPVAAGVTTQTILTVGDAVSNKRDGFTPSPMIGIPDGLGAYDNGDGTFTLLMNHEISLPSGIERDHGSNGAYVSRWKINKSTLKPISIIDADTSVISWNGTNAYNAPGTVAWSRFCSADLPAISGLSYGALGTTNRIFFDGEESGSPNVRGWAHVLTGQDANKAFELPAVGKMAFENILVNPKSQLKTVSMSMFDNGNVISSPSFLYLYVGTKTNTGLDIDKAGLTNGNLYGIKVKNRVGAGYVTIEDRTNGLGTTPIVIGESNTFECFNLGDVRAKSNTQLVTDSTNNSVMAWFRTEDGCWDPNNPSDFYFVTTDQMNKHRDNTGAQDGASRLWRLRYSDISQPELGGTVTLLVSGGGDNPGPAMMDNITVDKLGRVIICEDVGNDIHNGKVWCYDIKSGNLQIVVKHDPARFGDVAGGSAGSGGVATPAPTAPFTQDEETSGVIDASDLLGTGWYFIVVQAHYAIPGELVEGGQLLAMFIPPTIGNPTPDSVFVDLAAAPAENTDGDQDFKNIIPALAALPVAGGKAYVKDGAYNEAVSVDKPVKMWTGTSDISSLVFTSPSVDSEIHPGTPTTTGILHVTTGLANFSGGTRSRLVIRVASSTDYDSIYSSTGGLTLGGGSRLVLDLTGLTGTGNVDIGTFAGGVVGTFTEVEIKGNTVVGATVSYTGTTVNVAWGAPLSITGVSVSAANSASATFTIASTGFGTPHFLINPYNLDTLTWSSTVLTPIRTAYGVTPTSFTFANALPDGRYIVRVTAFKDISGTGPVFGDSTPITVGTPFDITGVNITAQTGTGVSFTYTTVGVGSPYYLVFTYEFTSKTWKLLTPNWTPALGSPVNQSTALLPGTYIYYVLVGNDVNGGATMSAVSTQFVVTPTPPSLTVADSGGAFGNNVAAAGARLFASQPTGTNSTPITFTLSNNGTTPMTITSVTLGGANANQFSLGTLTPASPIAINGSATFAVTFSPTTVGAKVATVSIVHDATNTASPFVINLSGTAITPPPPTMTVADSNGVFVNGAAATGIRAFGSVGIGVGSSPITITINNTGVSPLNITGLVLGGANPGQFTLGTLTPAGAIAPGGNATFSARFTPDNVGAKNATVSFTHNASNTSTPFVFSLNGTAITPPPTTMTVADSNGVFVNGAAATGVRAFGNQGVNVGSSPITITINNTGASSLAVSSINLAGNNPGQFTVGTLTPAGAIAAGGNATFTIRFAPDNLGAKDATVNIVHNASNTVTPFVINITGTGVAAPATTLTVADSNGVFVNGAAATGVRAFGAQTVNTSSTARTFTITNTGASPLGVSGLVLGGVNPGQFTLGALTPAGPIAPAGTATFTVTFTPNITGAKTVTAQFTHNGSNTATPFIINMSGTGQ